MPGILQKITRFFSSSASQSPTQEHHQKLRLSRDQHGISRKAIDKSALDVLYELKRAGYQAYLVGGGVRDLLLGLEPKDFDIVTDAKPDEVKAVFRHRCQLIGRRFRLAHIRFGYQVVEVATFRGEDEGKERQQDKTGRLIRDNVYGSLEEDVWRRDFTVNALYYDIRDFSLVDHVNGLGDIKAGQLRLIGDPVTRYHEDPVRMIRAVRFAAKLGFNIESQSEKPLFELGHLLLDVSNARMFDEVIKLFHSGVGLAVFEKLRHYDLFKCLFPQTDQLLASELANFPRQLVIEALKSTDRRIQEDKPVNPAFLFAAFLWESMIERRQIHMEAGLTAQDAFHAATNDVIEQQVKRTAIPKRFSSQVRDIWNLQFRLSKRFGARAAQLRAHPRFRAAYDFVGIRLAAGELELAELFNWWTEYQEKDAIEQIAFANEVQQVRERKPKKSKPASRNVYRRKNRDTDGAVG
ncbi:polynucleotide adenylyltransferase PcnB [Thiomicrospira sp. R3]|uniref:polynucleotide adenylyltransferase PcnB n=1 Tax=Thiomicrospira sp. R3 TaxID=3035472 RepID=UPI00259B2DE9|nr:polynucleotide adenylyltransferase PcnB [Thiomicrospira sp. R3]WFE69065.1 polynucleotide adenylyltransferase PcnB [Thiomicrospira sp. R3]